MVMAIFNSKSNPANKIFLKICIINYCPCPDMKKIFILFTILTFCSIAVYSQCVTNVDFNSWTKVGQPNNGNWVVQGGGTQVRQTINGDNSYFVSPFDLMNVRITGNFRSTDDDDDWMGFVFSFLDPMGPIDDYDCWLFDWKQDFQGAAPRGMSLCRIEGTIPPNMYGTYFNAHQNGPEFTVVQNNFGGPGWVRNFNHAFELRLTYTRATIYVDGNLIFDQVDCFKPGRFGFYNKSQRDCYYSNFQYDLYIDFSVKNDGRACLGDTTYFEFVNPCLNVSLAQYQSLTWNFGDGSAPIVINNPTFSNVNVKHLYQAVGNYSATLTVVDNNGCSATASRNVDIRTPISLSPTVTPPLCNGGLNGVISINPTGGFGNYTYSWNGGMNTQQVLNGVSAGTYTIQVTDGICVETDQITVNQPTPLTATTSHTDASCGQNDGSATIVIVGGTPPYQGVNWAGFPATGGPNTFTRTGLGAGMYIADFTDFNGCSALLQYRETIAALPCGINTNISQTNVSCFGTNNGTVSVNVTGGAPPSNISWGHGASGASLTGLAPGTYTYTYSDALPANSFSGTITITGPGAAMVAQLTTIPISCAGFNNGQAIASVISGGTPPYSFAWSGGQPNNPVATNLSPGNISVIITDANGCTANANGTISGTPSLAVSITTTIDSCYRSGRGSAEALVSGGAPPYSYLWNDFSTNPENDNLIAGNYTITVTDANGCSVTETATVTGPANQLTYTYTKQDVNCYGELNGNFDITVSGGTPGYTFSWNPGTVSGNNPTGLAAGLYNYTVTDAWGCFVIGGDTIFQPDTLLLATATATDINCHGANDGTITIFIDGGIPPYTYQGLPIPAGTTILTDLAAGNYTGDVVDSSGCIVTLNVSIAEPAGPQTLVLNNTDAICNGDNSATASADFVNATGTVTYQWTGGLTGANLTGLTAGIYEVTATDANGCELTGSVTVTEPAAPVLNVAVTDAVCFGGDGSVTANPTVGTPPYIYQWSNGAGDFQTIALPAGSYTVTASDASFCNQIGTFTVNEPVGMTIQVQQNDVNCYGESTGNITLNVSGGAGAPFTYVWNPNVSATQSAQNLAAGDYDFTVADAENCTITQTVTILEPDLLSVAETAADVSCYGFTDGEISINATGGTPGYTFALSTGPQNTNGLFTGLGVGSYTVTITDANNCSDIVTATISGDDEVLLSVTPDPVQVYEGESAELQTTTNQFGNIVYLWSPGDGLSCTDCADPVFSGSNSGIYSVTVINEQGCTGNYSLNVEVVSDIAIFVPNAFTPNGDGVNDDWQIFGNVIGIENIAVLVFNRWGEKVFESTDINFAWDAVYKGKILLPDVYVYHIRIDWKSNRPSSNLKGSVTLMK